MARIIVLGGGICGLGTALLLARDDHDVTVVERDDAPPPETPQEAWESWERKGVGQFRQPHVLVPGLRLLFEEELPDVEQALVAAGAARFDLVEPLPPAIEDRSSRPVDDRLWSHTARRPVVEHVFAQAARDEGRVTVRRGIRAVGLLTGPAAAEGIPHVRGIATADGREPEADLVVDATGRRSKSPDWLADAGARRPREEREDSGFSYYTRYFRGSQPQRTAPVVTPIGTISLLTLPGDNDTWSVTIYTATGDAPLKELRHADRWTATVRACPEHAHWLEGEPITDVLPMSGVVDRYRRFVVEGSPVATGFVAVADAWACTNPSAGRGVTVGLLHARRLRDVARDAIDDPLGLVEAFHEVTEDEIATWYWAQVAADRTRFAEIEALREGREPPALPGDLAERVVLLRMAMQMDPDLFRHGLEYVATITPLEEVLDRPEVAEGLRAAEEAMGEQPPPKMPGPTREELLEIVA